MSTPPELEAIADELRSIHQRLSSVAHAGRRLHPAVAPRTITAVWLASEALADALELELSGPPVAAEQLDAAASLLRAVARGAGARSE
ncbi:MAG: hypothetical protein F4089_05110 [Gammaproteobacteria bacterium]|nr:hypothetical protein [Gammaproteobacteria bacterium]